jgi:hypothetical protein
MYYSYFTRIGNDGFNIVSYVLDINDETESKN